MLQFKGFTVLKTLKMIQDSEFDAIKTWNDVSGLINHYQTLVTNDDDDDHSSLLDGLAAAAAAHRDSGPGPEDLAIIAQLRDREGARIQRLFSESKTYISTRWPHWKTVESLRIFTKDRFATEAASNRLKTLADMCSAIDKVERDQLEYEGTYNIVARMHDLAKEMNDQLSKVISGPLGDKRKADAMRGDFANTVAWITENSSDQLRDFGIKQRAEGDDTFTDVRNLADLLALRSVIPVETNLYQDPEETLQALKDFISIDDTLERLHLKPDFRLSASDLREAKGLLSEYTRSQESSE